MDFNFDQGSISSILELDSGASALTLTNTTGVVLPIGTTLQRLATMGILRFNTDLAVFEGFDGVKWIAIQESNSNLTALSNLNGTGFITQTAAGTFEERAINGTAGNIEVTNSSGIAGDVVIDLATAGTAGTYVSVTTDSFGRVTSGSATQDWATITGTPTTLAGYGITDAMQVGINVTSFNAGLSTAIPSASVAGAGAFYYSTDTNSITYSDGTSWSLAIPAFTGDVTSTVGGTLLTLATVNSNVGSFGDSSHVGSFTVNAKGLVTAASDVAITPESIGAININQLGVNSGVATLDTTGKLTASQVPDSLLGALQYQGVWDATTNTPTLASGVGVTGQYYKVSVAGTTNIDGQAMWQVGDMIVFNGTTWDGIDGNPSEVTSVFGRVGAVTATLASSDFANQGTTTTFLKGDAAGNPSWSSVSLTTDVSGTLQASQFPALTGDITTTAGGLGTTLATVNSNVGTFGDSTNVAQVTVNGKGLVTAVSNVAIPLDVVIGGDATGTGTTSTTTTLTLATVNSNVGSFGSSTDVPVITVNAKGLVTAVSTTSISSAISLIGDATGSGTTGSDITLTLATVNSNVGTFGTSSKVSQVTVNEKGLVTAATEVTITPSAIGAVANTGDAPSMSSGTFAAMPAAGTVGAVYITTDTHAIYRDNGTTWDQVGESAILYTENVSSPVASTVSGTNAVSIGSGNTVSGTNAIATGAGAATANYGAEVHANGSFTAAGDAQTGKYVLRNITTTATTTEVFLDGSSARIVLPNNSAFTYVAYAVARRTDATGSEGAWKIEGLISKDATASSTSLVGSRSKTVITRPNTNWNFEVAADTTHGALTFNVTGQASNTIRWVVTVITTEVAQ
jgi:hypothetical protein